MPRLLGIVLVAAWLLAGCHRSGNAPLEPRSVVLVAVGDVLMHQDVQIAARQKGGFEPLWEEVTPIFRKADLVFGNLETPVAPLLGQPGESYRFNGPVDLPEALKHSGFTIVGLANNHAYDQGTRGLQETLTRLEVAGLVALGTGRNQTLAAAPRILERNGLRIAFLAWTDLLNANLNREGKGPWVNLFEESQASQAVRAARLQADAVVVSLHWGKEDRHEPTLRQRAIAARLIDAGADLILGHHPHVLQPLEVRAIGERRVAVAYSLGNFISNQDRVYDPARMPLVRGDERDGAALVVTFTRVRPGQARLEKVGYIPLWTENNWRKAAPREIRVVRLDDPGRQLPPWSLRRERIRGILGGAAELRE